ncbi:MAG: hypothetical protein H7839_11850 [Magnetococcus sp. YQC-5]
MQLTGHAHPARPVTSQRDQTGSGIPHFARCSLQSIGNGLRNSFQKSGHPGVACPRWPPRCQVPATSASGSWRCRLLEEHLLADNAFRGEEPPDRASGSHSTGQLSHRVGICPTISSPPDTDFPAM